MEKINGIIKKVSDNKITNYLIIILVGIILSIPLKYIQIRDTHDGCLHYLRIMGTLNSFKLGQFPPIVAPFYCYGWGYSMNLFYNPLVTYIPLLLKLCIPSYMLMLKIYAGLCTILSGITMYIFVKNVTKNKTISLFAAILYMAAPYKLGDVYRRYAIGEFTSFIFMPMLFDGLYNLFKQDGKRHYLISISTILLLLTHTVTTFYLAIISFVYVLFNIKKLKEKDVIKKVIINLTFVILVCMFFIAPMMEARKKADYTIFDSEIMLTNGDYVYKNTLNIDRLFKEKVVIFEDTIFCLGIIYVALFITSVYTYKLVKKEYKDFYIIAVFFSIISVFMCTKFCPWFMFPDFFCKLQYPWRMLGFFNFFSAFVIGINLYILINMITKKTIIKIMISIIVFSMIITNSISIMMQFKTKDEHLDEKYIKIITDNICINPLNINREYMTINALVEQKDYLQEREHDKIYITSGSAQILEDNKEELSMTAKINNIEKDTILEFPFLYYPGYQMTITKQDGTVEKQEAIESEKGFASFKFNEDINEEINVIVQFKPTKITIVSYMISGVSLIALILYITLEKRKYKKEKNER